MQQCVVPYDTAVNVFQANALTVAVVDHIIFDQDILEPLRVGIIVQIDAQNSSASPLFNEIPANDKVFAWAGLDIARPVVDKVAMIACSAKIVGRRTFKMVAFDQGIADVTAAQGCRAVFMNVVIGDLDLIRVSGQNAPPEMRYIVVGDGDIFAVEDINSTPDHQPIFGRNSTLEH